MNAGGAPPKKLTVAGDISASGHFATALSASIGGNFNLTGSGAALTVQGDISASGDLYLEGGEVYLKDGGTLFWGSLDSSRDGLRTEMAAEVVVAGEPVHSSVLFWFARSVTKSSA